MAVKGVLCPALIPGSQRTDDFFVVLDLQFSRPGLGSAGGLISNFFSGSTCLATFRCGFVTLCETLHVIRIMPESLPENAEERYHDGMAKEAKKKDADSEGKSSGTIKVLLVDNDKDHAKAMTESLERIGLDCTTATAGPDGAKCLDCLLYTSPSPRDQRGSRMPSSA